VEFGIERALHLACGPAEHDPGAASRDIIHSEPRRLHPQDDFGKVCGIKPKTVGVLILGKPSVISRRIGILLFLKQSSKTRGLLRRLLEDDRHAADDLGRIYRASIVCGPRVGISIPYQDGQVRLAGTRRTILLRNCCGRCKNLPGKQENVPTARLAQGGTPYRHGSTRPATLAGAEHIRAYYPYRQMWQEFRLGTGSRPRLDGPGPYGAKYPLTSITRSVALLAYMLMAPLVPAGTMAALPTIWPFSKFTVAAFGTVFPAG
jgi:hypothetical protein